MLDDLEEGLKLEHFDWDSTVVTTALCLHGKFDQSCSPMMFLINKTLCLTNKRLPSNLHQWTKIAQLYSHCLLRNTGMEELYIEKLIEQEQRETFFFFLGIFLNGLGHGIMRCFTAANFEYGYDM